MPRPRSSPALHLGRPPCHGRPSRLLLHLGRPPRLLLGAECHPARRRTLRRPQCPDRALQVWIRRFRSPECPPGAPPAGGGGSSGAAGRFPSGGEKRRSVSRGLGSEAAAPKRLFFPRAVAKLV